MIVVHATFFRRLAVLSALAMFVTGCPTEPVPQNQAPIAEAGPAQTVNGGSDVQLDGTASSDPDGDTLTFEWTQSAGTPAGLVNVFTATPSFRAANVNATLRFTLEVADPSGETSVDVVVITVVAVDNVAPQANAGLDRGVGGGDVVSLDGSASSDADGDTLTYQWTQTSGPAVTLNDSTSSVALFTAANADATLVFELTVDDGNGNTDTDSVTILVDLVPTQLFVADAGTDQVLSWQEPQAVDGDEEPTTTLSGNRTQILAPSDVIVTDFNSLVVSIPASDALLFFQNGPAADGNVQPSFTIQGTSTLLNNPVSLAYLPVFDIIFVANSGGDFDILVFDAPSTVPTANLPPARVISSDALSIPTGMALDGSANLYVANNGAGNVLVFENADEADGSLEPSRTITSSAFAGPFDVFVDRQDNLFVVENSGTVHVFEVASQLDGEVSPTRSFSVANAQSLTSIAVDAGGTGFLTDLNAGVIYSLDNVASLVGVQEPVRTIEGANTGLDRPLRLYLLDR